MGSRQSLYTICRAHKQNTPTCSEVIHIVVCRVRPRLEAPDESEFSCVVEGSFTGAEAVMLDMRLISKKARQKV